METVCKYINNPEYPAYLIEYRGDFLGEMKNIDYACGYTINDKYGILLVRPEDLSRIRKEVKSILLVDFRDMYVLQETSPSDTSGISPIKKNPYLGLDGRGILIGIVDTGIDYLNKDFILEDGTTKILAIWDQTINDEKPSEKIYGKFFFEKDINNALKAKAEGKNPYDIVPSKDEDGHGTKMAGIMAGKGYSKEYEGVAQNASLAVVKLYPSPNFEDRLRKNGINNVKAYNNSEIVVAIEFLKDYAKLRGMPLVIFIGVGSTEGSHDGSGLLVRYISEVASYRGIAIVSGTGNEGASEGHYSGVVANKGDITTVELVIPKAITYFQFRIWVKKPNRMSVNITSPSGEQSRFIVAKINQSDIVKFYYENTEAKVDYFDPENISGNEAINIIFKDIKPGIWKFQLRGEYISDGKFNIWLPPYITLPEGTKFLKPDPNTTLTIPSTATKIISVAYYDSSKNSIVLESGNGFDINGKINPDIAAPGVNILTTRVGGGTSVASGSSVAAAITAGVAGLVFQWAIIYKNDISINNEKLESYLISGALRPKGFEYPNVEWGYGLLSLEGTFNSISGKRSSLRYVSYDDKYKEYTIKSLFIRIPREMVGENYEGTKWNI